MSFLQQIRDALVDEKSDLNSVLLELRLLEAKLGSDILEEWVKLESEGYLEEIEVPSYRVVNIRYLGVFTKDGNEPKKGPIPSSLIKKHVGEDWTKHEVRESIVAIEEIEKGFKEGKQYGFNASRLLQKLPDEIYENYTCREVYSLISRDDLREITKTVRNKLLELTSKIESSVPSASKLEFRV